MFIADDEYLITSTDLGYISAKRIDGEWTISLPPQERENPRFSDVETRFSSVLEALTANTIPLELVPVRGNLRNMAGGRPLSAIRELMLRTVPEVLE